MSMPLVSMDLDSVRLEEQYMREKFLYQQNKKGEDDPKQMIVHDTYIMQMVEAAMKSDKLDRALSLCDFIQFEKPLNALISLANQMHLGKLADRMQQLLVQYFCWSSAN